ncbi:Putative mitochondrial ATP-dependent helicase irc3 [Wickerhamiella sorbophila]|uniref:Mitochondrial ATP-dependent helicase irc3 n=1 Tax=Wickerhamiella sorbophila TaxID=45607 RepID=A0A2T0FJ01_9ASCO|nr:Putative mitochondrial ATP-dependent helicase irc3 [Wickerhamiella sorbophila]PRT54919.1 Putative mitochondrial ATP-dependent helicase irc3 [Wickerhamiella sorbophila]
MLKSFFARPIGRALRRGVRNLGGIELRPYQQECIDTVLDRLNFQRRAAISLPTGSGKTVVFSKLVSLVDPLPEQGPKTLILTNRRELCYQTAHTLQAMYPNMKVALEIGTKRFEDQRSAEVCVASVASISRDNRLEQFTPSDFKMIIIDEAHHTAAATYKKVLDYFGVNKPDCNIYLVGFSATFFRHDARPLDGYFDDVFYHRQVQSMIESGHLCRAQVTNVKAFGGGLLGAEKIRGENHVLKSDEGIELVVSLWKEHSNYKSTVIFTMDIDQADRLVARFREDGVDCRGVHGNMRSAERDLVISDFKQQKFPIIVNCGILTEGTDIPCIDQIILARPIASIGLAMQMIGRGLRVFPGKDHCHVIQFIELTNYSGPTDLSPILAGKEPRTVGSDAEIGENTLPPGETAAIKDIELEHHVDYSINDIFTAKYKPKSPRESPLSWIFHQKRWYLFGPPSQPYHFRVVQKKSRQTDEPVWTCQQGYKIPIKGKQFKVWKYLDKFETKELKSAIQATEQLAENSWGRDALVYLSKHALWRGLPPTPKQLQLLQRDKSFQVIQELCPKLNRGTATTLINFKILNYNLNPGLIRAAT